MAVQYIQHTTHREWRRRQQRQRYVFNSSFWPLFFIIILSFFIVLLYSCISVSSSVLRFVHTQYPAPSTLTITHRNTAACVFERAISFYLIVPLAIAYTYVYVCVWNYACVYVRHCVVAELY